MLCDAEKLPFPDNYFDRVSVAFGLRNMTHKDEALAEMRRVLKPGGKLLVLEFSKVAAPLQKPYDVYSFSVLPWLGQNIAGDAESYRYLAESIRMHPDQETLKTMMEDGGPGARPVLQPDGRCGRFAHRYQAVILTVVSNKGRMTMKKFLVTTLSRSHRILDGGRGAAHVPMGGGRSVGRQSQAVRRQAPGAGARTPAAPAASATPGAAGAGSCARRLPPRHRAAGKGILGGACWAWAWARCCRTSAWAARWPA